MYAVVAPGFSNIYSNWADVERIKALYPYPKWCKCHSEEEAARWIKRNAYSFKALSTYRYGNTFDRLYVDVNYYILPNSVCYNINCSRVGNIRLPTKSAIVEYKGSMIYVRIPEMKVSDESMSGHMSVVYNLLHLLGEYIDINLIVHHYSIFYALFNYSGEGNRHVVLVQNEIKKRIGEFAITLDNRTEEVII